jgi:KRAB domain-containing zinc finger protein
MLLDNHYATKHCDDLPFKCQFCTRLFASKTARNNHHYIAHKDSKTVLKFKCDKCNVYFEMKEELRIHSFIHFNGEILHCSECDQIFKTNRLLKIHMQKHETKKTFQCTQCGDFFTFKTGLAKHIRLNRCKGPVNAEDDEQCKLNEEEIAEIALGQLKDITKTKVVIEDEAMFEDETLFQDEMEESQSEVEKGDVDFDLPEVEKILKGKVEVEEFKFEDEIISKETRKLRKKKAPGLVNIKSHKGRAHLTYTCDYCGDKIKYYKDIVKHFKEHTINLRYKCKGEQCHQAFKSRKKLVDHSIEVHGTKPQVVKEAFACETCGRMFDMKSAYEAHKLSHDDNARNHICSICSSGFKSIGNLRRHEAIHTATRDFQCDSCPKAFKTQLALKIHTEVVHAELKVFVNCEFCKAIIQEKHLNQHIKNQHTEEGQEKPFECSACGKTFRTFKLGQRHYEAVHEPKDRGVVYTCPQCPELQFYRQRDLKEHSFIHFDGTIFQCDECLKMFKSKRLLMIHRASHNNVGFPCKMCNNVVFKTRGGRRKHMLKLHNGEDKIEYQETTIEEENEKQTFVIVNHQILRQ